MKNNFRVFFYNVDLSVYLILNLIIRNEKENSAPNIRERFADLEWIRWTEEHENKTGQNSHQMDGGRDVRCHATLIEKFPTVESQHFYECLSWDHVTLPLQKYCNNPCLYGRKRGEVYLKDRSPINFLMTFIG